MTDPNILAGVASDDSGVQPINPVTEENTTDSEESTIVGATTDPSINEAAQPNAERESGSTAPNTQGTPPYENEEFDRIRNNTQSRPGRRLKNPLGYLASYTYQLSLYMISSDAYDAFIASGRRNINAFTDNIAGSDAAQAANRTGGAFLVAQSGGVGSDPRIPGNKFDYYIDNLSFKYLVSAKETLSPVGNIEFKFQIIEPYGFNFVSTLKNAQKELERYARGSRWEDTAQSTIPAPKQFFVLGIRFYGWDQSGRQVYGDEVFDGTSIDPDSLGNGAIFETFYDIVFTEVKYKIEGKAMVYNISAAPAATRLGVGMKKGIINSGMEVAGATVRDMLSGPRGLITKLNKEQQDLKNNNTITYPITYKIRWVGDAEEIAVASVVSDSRQNRANQPASTAENTEEVNDQTDVTSSPNNTEEVIGIESPKPIIQALDSIIARSKYLEDSMTVNYTDSNEYDPETDSLPSDASPERKFKWYRIIPSISNINWDDKTHDWAYDITYNINTYLVPVIDNPYVANTINYYGPHKRYDYWYTGENSEILGYEQSLDNNYFNVAVADPSAIAGNSSTQPGNATEGNAGAVAVAPNTIQGLDTETAGGTAATAAVASVRTSLYDPASYVKARINILGDPDFLMREITSGTVGLNEAIDRRDRFYEGTNSFTVNPTGGQVFIEIDFKEAVDYSTSEVSELYEDGRGVSGIGGTLAINDSILFWDYPAAVKDKVKGISYTLTSLVSTFRNGQFTQALDAYINDFGTGEALTEESRNEFTQGGGATTTGGTSSSEQEAVNAGAGFSDQADAAAGTTTDPQPGTAQTPGTSLSQTPGQSPPEATS